MPTYHRIQAEAHLKENPYNRKWQYILKRMGNKDEVTLPESAISEHLAEISGANKIPKGYEAEFGKR